MGLSLIRVLFAAMITLLSSFGVHGRQNGEVILGVYPYLTPSQITAQYKPLRDYLQAELGRPVSLVSAPGFAEFIQRTRAGEYDVIFTAPHMGRLAETRDGYQRVAQTGYRIVVALVCRKDAPLHAIEDLRGKSVAIGAKLSMTYQVVDHALRAKGLVLGDSVVPLLTASFSNVMEATLRGEADVGAIPTAVLANAPAEQRAAVREIHRTPATPGGLVMASPAIDPEMLARLRQAFLDLSRHPQGAAFFSQSKLQSFEPLDEETMQRIDPYTAVLRKE